MRKEVFAICDPDREYTSGFTDYLSSLQNTHVKQAGVKI